MEKELLQKSIYEIMIAIGIIRENRKLSIQQRKALHARLTRILFYIESTFEIKDDVQLF